MDQNEHIFSDEDLRYFTECTPLEEGGTLPELLDEAQQVAKAIEKTGENLSQLDAHARALFFMMGFYFLGVLRGGEAYRSQLLDEVPGAEEPPTMEFELSASCAQSWVFDLRGKPTETLQEIYKTVGLTANRAERRGARR